MLGAGLGLPNTFIKHKSTSLHKADSEHMRNSCKAFHEDGSLKGGRCLTSKSVWFGLLFGYEDAHGAQIMKPFALVMNIFCIKYYCKSGFVGHSVTTALKWCIVAHFHHAFLYFFVTVVVEPPKL